MCRERGERRQRHGASITCVLELPPRSAGDNWNESSWGSWMLAVYRNRAFGYSIDHMFDFSVTADVKNSTWRILDLDQPSLGLPRKYLIKGERTCPLCIAS